MLDEIRRVAADIGAAPGRSRFETETGIKPTGWGRYWAGGAMRSWKPARAEHEEPALR